MSNKHYGKKALGAAAAMAGVAGAVAAGAGMAVRYRGYIGSLVGRLQAGSRVAHTALGAIEYAQHGDESAPAVLVVHGIGGGYDQGMLVTRMVNDQPFRLIAVSRFGYLRSPLPSEPAKASPGAQADLYAALLDTLGIKRATIVGISAGGPSAIQFALRHPERCSGLITVSAVTGRLVPKLTRLESFMVEFLNRDMSLWVMSTLSEQRVMAAYGLTPQFKESLEATPEKLEIVRAILFSPPVNPRRAGFNNDMRLFPTLPVYPVEELRVPVMAMHGTADTVVPFAHGRFIAERAPGARFLPVEGGGHLCIVTHSEQALPPLLEFMREHAG